MPTLVSRQDFSHECVFREDATSALAVPLPCPLVVVAPGSEATFREGPGNKEACFHRNRLGRMKFPLHCEVTLNSSLETVENCLKGGEDPNDRDDYGSAPLHCVNCYGKEAYKMVQLLLNHGANLLRGDGLDRLLFQHALDHANTKAEFKVLYNDSMTYKP